MFKKKKNNFQIDTLIDSGMKINGLTEVSGGLRLDGKIYGDLNFKEEKPGAIVIGENGLIEGNIAVPTAVIAGKVLGNIIVSEYLEIESTGIVEGDISYNLIEIHAGAIVKGIMIKLGKTQADKANKNK